MASLSQPQNQRLYGTRKPAAMQKRRVDDINLRLLETLAAEGVLGTYYFNRKQK